VIPRESRPRAYAGVELLLELMHILREATQLDHDSIIIACVVNHATMRPLLTGPGAPLDPIGAADPTDDQRGSISRSAVADITGIPRETVRRKINHLIEIGMEADLPASAAIDSLPVVPRLGGKGYLDLEV
jgi:hypothetical protein